MLSAYCKQHLDLSDPFAYKRSYLLPMDRVSNIGFIRLFRYFRDENRVTETSAKSYKSVVFCSAARKSPYHSTSKRAFHLGFKDVSESDGFVD